MATFDFTPMFRSTVGYEQLPELLSGALERRVDGYPPYNIEQIGPDDFLIVMAVAGFAKDDVEIIQSENRLTVKGTPKNEGSKTYLYRGLASRPFTREFDLANYVEVTAATLQEGILTIELKRELPEAMKPRTIPIKGESNGVSASRLEKQAA
jgi:molecular chaperone IbpA